MYTKDDEAFVYEMTDDICKLIDTLQDKYDGQAVAPLLAALASWSV